MQNRLQMQGASKKSQALRMTSLWGGEREQQQGPRHETRLEGHAEGGDDGVVVGVVVGGGDLEAGAGYEGYALVDGETAEDQAGGEEGLLLAVVGTALVDGGVDFDFRPELFEDVGLKRGVGEDGAAEFVDAVHGECAAEGGLDVEEAPALAAGEGGRDDGADGAVLVVAGGDAAAEERGDDAVAFLLRAREQAVLEGEGGVAPAVDSLGILV